MTCAVAVAVMVVALAASVVAQIGQGSSAQTRIGTKLRTLSGCPATTVYTPTSSVLGQNALKAGATTGVDFALSDIPTVPCSAKSTIINVPYILGLMSVHTKPGPVVGVKWSACAVVRLYTCVAKTFNDPVLLNGGLNPGLRTVTGAVAPIARSEASGTTATFTSFLGKSCPTWKFGSVALLSNVPALRPCVAKLKSARGTAGVVALYGATAGAVAYVQAAAIVGGDVLLQGNTARGGYFLSTQTNTGLLTPLITPAAIGTPVCSPLLDITGARANTYPLAYIGFFLAWKARPGKPNPATLQALCKCIIGSNQALVSGLPDFRPLPTSLIAVANTRCGLIK